MKLEGNKTYRIKLGSAYVAYTDGTARLTSTPYELSNNYAETLMKLLLDAKLTPTLIEKVIVEKVIKYEKEK